MSGLAAGKILVEKERDQQGQHGDGRDRHDRKQHRPLDRQPELRVGQHGGVIAEPNERHAGWSRELQRKQADIE